MWLNLFGVFFRDRFHLSKSSIDYQICSACEERLKNNLMYEYIDSIKDQFELYFDIIKFFFYFCIGAILLFFLKKLFKLFQFLTYKFNKDFFFEKLQISLNIFIFVIISILLGWLVVYLFTFDIL